MCSPNTGLTRLAVRLWVQLRKDIYLRLTPVQRLSVARHPNRPTFLDHVLNITDKVQLTPLFYHQSGDTGELPARYRQTPGPCTILSSMVPPCTILLCQSYIIDHNTMRTPLGSTLGNESVRIAETGQVASQPTITRSSVVHVTLSSPTLGPLPWCSGWSCMGTGGDTTTPPSCAASVASTGRATCSWDTRREGTPRKTFTATLECLRPTGKLAPHPPQHQF